MVRRNQSFSGAQKFDGTHTCRYFCPTIVDTHNPLPAHPTAPGSLPAAFDREMMMGLNIPPARADVEGMAGAMNVSAKVRP